MNNFIYKIDYFGFVYEWYDSKRKMKYIGSHHGPVDDYYKGSNQRFQRAIKKRPNDFSRIILEYVNIDNQDEILKCEQKWLDTVINIKDNEEYYNKKNEAKGGWSFITKKHIKKRAKSIKKWYKKNKNTIAGKTLNKNRQKTRKNRWNTKGFSEKEIEQHSKYGYKIKIIDPNNIEYIFNSCGQATRELGIDTRYGLCVCETKESFKGYKIIKLSDPIIDCRS